LGYRVQRPSEQEHFAVTEEERAITHDAHEGVDSLFGNLPVRAQAQPAVREGRTVPPPPPRRSLAPLSAPVSDAQPEPAAPLQTGPRPIVAKDVAELQDDVIEDVIEAVEIEAGEAEIGDLLTEDGGPDPDVADALTPGPASAQTPIVEAIAASAPQTYAPIAPSYPAAALPSSSSSKSPLAIGGVVAAVIAACFAWYMFDQKSVPGVVQVTTLPADAVVLFDGLAVGSASPVLKTGIPPRERHRLEVRREGYLPWAQEVELQPSQTLFFTVTLQPIPGREPAPVAAAAAPSTAPAAKSLALAPSAEQQPPEQALAPAASDERAAEPETLEPSATPAPRKVTPAPRKAAAAKKAAEPGALGTLRVSSRPWSLVHVDGKLIGNTPQMNLQLPEGAHQIKLVNPEFDLTKTVTVKVRAGETETVIVDLQ
jgi:hypothetical protein